MYLLAKTDKKVGKKETTGACGGLFPLTIKTEEKTQEIGYWRKNYKLDEELTNMLFEGCEDDNCVPKEMSAEQIEDVIAFAKDEIELKDYENGWYNDDDWKYTIKVFQKALKLLKQGVTILYEKWY